MYLLYDHILISLSFNCLFTSLSIIGSYTDSRGITIIRKHVQEFITARDGIPANYESIFLTNGATDGIKVMLIITGSMH